MVFWYVRSIVLEIVTNVSEKFYVFLYSALWYNYPTQNNEMQSFLKLIFNI